MSRFADEGEASDAGDGRTPYTPTRLEWLALQLNAQARLFEDDARVATMFKSQPPNTIVVWVGHGSKVSFERAKNAAEYGAEVAKNMAKNFGWDAWVRVKCEWKEVD